jgi:arylsulfatase A-like enzyme
MFLRNIVKGVLVFASIALHSSCSAQKKITEKPNIILIYVDDLGYGDVSCYGATKVKTPSIDKLAASGLKFLDAHCTAATCTPSRFSLLTGRYAFRNDAANLPGDAPLLIKPGSGTLSALLQKAGYTTGVVGKWHLGLGIGTIDWNKPISPGPLEVGFNYSFIIPATTDRVPTVFVENHHVPNLDPADPIEVSYKGKIGNEPTGLSHPELLKMKADTQHSNTIINGISRIGFMRGGNKARWKDEDIADVLTSKAKTFIIKNKGKLFFLYFSIPDIHVPRAPHERFAGTTEMGRRGDVIAEMDWMTGEITKQLEASGLKNNTLIIFTSDNGPVLDDGYDDEAEKLVGGHQPSGKYRGGKYSAYEGGTRVPTITYWPGKIKPSVCNTMFSQIDLLASLAALAGQQLPADAAPDSENKLSVLLGQSKKGRDYMLEEAFTLALRKGNWKYIAPQEKGTPEWLENKKIETGLMSVPQLYNLKNDPAELHNLANQHPEIVKQLDAELNRIRKVNGTRIGFPKN